VLAKIFCDSQLDLDFLGDLQHAMKTLN